MANKLMLNSYIFPLCVSLDICATLSRLEMWGTLILLLHFDNLLLQKLELFFKDFTFQCDNRQNNFICREHTLEVLFVSSSIPLKYTKCKLRVGLYQNFNICPPPPKGGVWWGKKKNETHTCVLVSQLESGNCIIASLLLVDQCICMFTHNIVHTNIGLRHSHTSPNFSHSH
jgi:hypothetical protein